MGIANGYRVVEWLTPATVAASPVLTPWIETSGFTKLLPFLSVGQLVPPSGLGAAANVGGGTFAAATYFWKITGTNAGGETTGSNEATVAVALNGTATLTWSALPAGTTGVKVYRGTVTNTENVLVATLGAVVTYTDTGTAGSGATPPVTSPATVVTCEYGTDGATADPDFPPVTITAGAMTPPDVLGPYLRFRITQTAADATKTKLYVQARF